MLQQSKNALTKVVDDDAYLDVGCKAAVNQTYQTFYQRGKQKRRSPYGKTF
jgi:hypothetical protein